MSYTITKGIKRVDGCEDFELCGVDSIGCSANVSVSFNGNDEIHKVKVVNPHKADNQDASEWPQVGDEVVTRGGSKGVVKINKPDKDGMIVCDFDGEYALTYKSELSKPKTPEEELCDDIVWLTIKHMENKSHPTEINADYLFSDLMGKYNITKKA